MSGSGHRSRVAQVLSIRALTVLGEARGEVEQAQIHMAVIMVWDPSVAARLSTMTAEIMDGLVVAMRAKELDELEQALARVEAQVQQCVEALHQASIPPTTEWYHQRQAAADWLACSVGRLKVAMSYARLELFLKSQSPVIQEQ